MPSEESRAEFKASFSSPVSKMKSIGACKFTDTGMTM